MSTYNPQATIGQLVTLGLEVVDGTDGDAELAADQAADELTGGPAERTVGPCRIRVPRLRAACHHHRIGAPKEQRR